MYLLVNSFITWYKVTLILQQWIMTWSITTPSIYIAQNNSYRFTYFGEYFSSSLSYFPVVQLFTAIHKAQICCTPTHNLLQYYSSIKVLISFKSSLYSAVRPRRCPDDAFDAFANNVGEKFCGKKEISENFAKNGKNVENTKFV